MAKKKPAPWDGEPEKPDTPDTPENPEAEPEPENYPENQPEVLAEVLPPMETPESPPDPERAEQAAQDVTAILDSERPPEREPELFQPAPQPAPVPPRKRGRPPGSKTRSRTAPATEAAPRATKAPPILDPVEKVKPALRLTFGAVGRILSNFRGEHWRFSDEEQKELAEAWAPVLAPYLENSAEYLGWATAVAATYGIVAPRLAMDRASKPVEISPGVEVHAGPAPYAPPAEETEASQS